jgi:hypothetical protein
VGRSDVLRPNEAQGQVGLGGHVPVSFRDALVADEAQEADGEIAQGRHDPWAIFRSDLRAILVVSAIPHVVGAVFNRPVPPVGSQNLLGRGFFRRSAGDSISRLHGGLSGLDDGSFPLDGEDLRHMREAHVLNESGGGPDPADLQATMALVFLDEAGIGSLLQAQVGDVLLQIGLVGLDGEVVVGLFLIDEEGGEFFWAWMASAVMRRPASWRLERSGRAAVISLLLESIGRWTSEKPC